jgi:glycosyltransferase involved in cell wall biosynthesis
MNILFLDQFYTVGGGQRSLLELLPMVGESGWNACVALPAEGPYARKVRIGGSELEILPCGAYTQGRKGGRDMTRFARELPETVRRLAAIVDHRRIGLIYVNGPRLLPAAALVAKFKSIPLTFHAHHRITQRLAARVAGNCLRYAKAEMIACCRFAEAPLTRYVPEQRRRVIYNGVPQPAWSRRPRDPSRPWNIGVVGRVEPEKGQLEFVAAARVLASECGNCRFVVAGAPLFCGNEYLDKVKAASKGLPIEFLGWQDDIGKVFSRLDLLVTPSSDIDSTPRVIVEAFAGGLPVVAYPAGGIPEIVEDGRTGFLTRGNTPAALAERIHSVMRMGLGPLRTVTENAQAAWRAKYALQQFQQEVGAVIAQALSRTSAKKRNAENIAIRPDATRTGG